MPNNLALTDFDEFLHCVLSKQCLTNFMLHEVMIQQFRDITILEPLLPFTTARDGCLHLSQVENDGSG